MVNVCNRVHCHWQYTTSARSSCRREVRNGPTWSIGWSRQAQESTIIVLLTFVKNKLCFILYVFVALGAVARVNWVIPCDLPEYINYVSLTWMSAGYPQHSCPLVGLGGGWGHGWWMLYSKTCHKKRQKMLMGPWKGFTPKFRACHPRMMSPRKLKFLKGQKWPHQIGRGSLSSVLLLREPWTTITFCDSEGNSRFSWRTKVS